MATITGEKSEAELDKAAVRQSNFYNQTVSENNTRLDNHSTFSDLVSEIKFIESVLLIAGPPK